MAKRTGIEIFIDQAKIAHRNVYENFRRAAVLENISLHEALSGEFYTVAKSSPSHPNSVEINGAMRIERLPIRRREAKPSPRDPGIFVLMNSTEVFKFQGKPEPENSFLYKSMVRMGYYQRTTEKKWRTLCCIRYDYDSAHDGHPLFHAQMEEGVLTRDAARIFTGVPEILPGPSIHTGIRIPTANVTGATALLKLAADHLPAKSFKEVLTVIQAQPFFNDWRCDCSSLDNVNSVRGLLSSGWYGGK
jgi:hypothetical protein